MSSTLIIDALNLPVGARVDQRVPKKLLLEQGAPTTSDKRQIQDGIEEVVWIAALKPINIGVPAFKDNVREYLEIDVINISLRNKAKPTRLIELVHRAIPYPVLLITTHIEAVNFSLAHKRWSQGEAGKVVIEEVRRTAPFQPDIATAEEKLFLASLALSRRPGTNMFALYQGWFDCVSALEAARITTVFTMPNSAGRSSALREGLDKHDQIQRDIIALRTQAKKAKQINRRVELNLEIKRLESESAIIKEKLRMGVAQ